MRYSKILLPCCIPVVYFLLSVGVFSFALNSSQRHRLYLLPLFLTTSTLAFTSSKYFWFSPTFASLWVQSDLLYVLHVISLLYIEQIPAPACSTLKSPTKQQQQQRNSAPAQQWSSYLRSIWLHFGNPRLISVAVPGEPQRALPPYQPRSVFVLLRLAKLPLYYYIHFHILPLLFSHTIVDITSADVSPTHQQNIIRNIIGGGMTAREVLIRAYTATYWIWESLVVYDGANAVLASLSVTLGIDGPADWPPLFGYPTSALGVRNFWKHFWHGLATRPYTSYGRLFAKGLGLQPRSTAFKAVVAFVVFSLSGLTHAAIAWQLGRRDWYLDIFWFYLNFVACFAELGWLSATRNLAKRMKCSRELQLIEGSWLGHLVAYTWVFMFFFWSVPQWQYPRMYTDALVAEEWYSIFANMQIVRS